MMTGKTRLTALFVSCVSLAICASVVMADASGIVSDDFNQCALDTTLWTVVDPVGAATVSTTGLNAGEARLSIILPAGTDHDTDENGSNDVRVMQSANNTDFDIQVKLDSVFDAGYQMYGLIVEQDAGVLLRYVLVSDASIVFLYSATLEGGVIVPRGQLTVANIVPFWLRVTRVGDQWTLRYSTNGADWLDLSTFAFVMNVTRVGPAAGNLALTQGGQAPAFTALFDYFFNTAEPIAVEDDPTKGAGYTLTTTVTGGGSVTVNPNQGLYCGETVTLTAVPNSGWVFSAWSGDASGSNNPIQVVMSADKSVTATFTSSSSGSPAPTAMCGAGIAEAAAFAMLCLTPSLIRRRR